MWCLTLILENTFLLLFLKHLLSLVYPISILVWNRMHLLYVRHSLFMNTQSWILFHILYPVPGISSSSSTLPSCLVYEADHHEPSSFLPLWSEFLVLLFILSQSFCVLVNLCSYTLSTFFPLEPSLYNHSYFKFPEPVIAELGPDGCFMPFDYTLCILACLIHSYWKPDMIQGIKGNAMGMMVLWGCLCGQREPVVTE